MDANDAAADFTFTQSFAAAQAVGAQAGTVHIDWNSDEGPGSGTTSGTFTDTSSQLADVNAFYPSVASSISITIAPIDTSGPRLPSDLAGTPMNNPTVIARFNKFIDWVFSNLPNSTLTSIQIGNEIDAPPSASSASYWSEYNLFITAVANHAHAAKPGIKVGVTVTLYGLIGQGAFGSASTAGITALLPNIDVLGLTYYPLDSGYMAKKPSVVAGDFAAVFALATNTPVYIQEVGYPTSATCGGSAENQLIFIDNVFSAWDAYAAKIPFLSFLRMNDYSAAYAASEAALYGLGGNAAFVAYLQTLGLRTYPAPSSFKPAWAEIQDQTRLRGWW